MKYIKFISLVLISLFLNACATTAMYTPPSSQQPSAILHGSMQRQGLFAWHSSWVTKVDNKGISDFLTMNPKIRIAPGPHTIVVQAQFIKGISTPVQGSNIALSFVARPNQKYIAVSEDRNDVIAAWVEDKQHHIVSKVVSKSYQVIPQNVYIPMTVIR